MAVLYRKYRPTRLEDVVGQEQVTTVLANSLRAGNISHAFLFIGPRGTGKTSVARILAHAVNGFDYTVEDSYLDIIEIDAASNTGVDNIRELREKAIIAPTKGKYKVYIIDEVHMLTKSAANALLKTLEEPPEHVIFIMATTDAHRVPVTITSRTQIHTFKLARPDTMREHLRRIATAENIKITDDALDIVVHRGGGSFRDSLSLLDQIAALADAQDKASEITADMLNRALGLPQDTIINQLLQDYSTNNINRLQTSLNALLAEGIHTEVLVTELINAITKQPRRELLPLLAKLPTVVAPFAEAKLLLAFLEEPTGSIPTKPAQSVEPTEPAKPTRLSTTKPTEVKPTPLESATNQSSATTHTAKSPFASSTTPFDWQNFLENVRDLNPALEAQLRKCTYDYSQDTLNLYPKQKFIKNVLEKSGNRQILMHCLKDKELIIHELAMSKPPKDPTVSQISAIMGDVQEIDGNLPF